MSRAKPDSPFVALIKSVLKENGFRCRGNICTPKGDHDLHVQINFRNQWGRPLHDVGILIKDSEFGWLMTGDLDRLFENFMDIFQDFREEELRDLRGDAEERIRAAFVNEIVPQALAWTEYEYFLTSVDMGRAGYGIFMPAIEKLKTKVGWEKSAN